MKITVAFRDKVGKNFVRKEIKLINDLAKLDMERIAKETEQVIQNTIMSKTQMPTGKLASYFYAENLSSGSEIAWGIGNIDELDKEVPYWNHCLSSNTEVYVEIDKFIVPKKLEEVLIFWQKNKKIKILTPIGLKKIESIWKVPLKEYYSFNISKWFSVEMSGNHKLIYKLNNGFFEKTADSFGSSFNCYSTLFATLKSVNNYCIKELEIDNELIKLDYLFGWILGIILAEGTFALNKIMIPQKNIDKLAYYITEFCKRFDYLPRIESKYNNNCDRLVITNKKIVDLIKNFISGKAYNKKFNNLILNTPIEYRQGILDGVQVGDGRQSCEDNFEIRIVSEVLRNQLILIGSSLGYDCSIWKGLWHAGKGSFKSNYFIKGGNILNHCRKYNVKHLYCDKIGQDRKGLAKNRDKNGRILSQKYMSAGFDYFPKSIINIQKFKQEKEFIDLRVEDKLFLINGGIVSHNCDKGSEGIGANWQHFLPKGFWINGRWVESPNGYAGIQPQSPIQAVNYIAQTIAEMDTRIRQLLSKVVIK